MLPTQSLVPRSAAVAWERLDAADFRVGEGATVALDKQVDKSPIPRLPAASKSRVAVMQQCRQESLPEVATS